MRTLLALILLTACSGDPETAKQVSEETFWGGEEDPPKIDTPEPEAPSIQCEPVKDPYYGADSARVCAMVKNLHSRGLVPVCLGVPPGCDYKNHFNGTSFVCQVDEWTKCRISFSEKLVESFVSCWEVEQ